jgi:hypothetical protein
MVLYRKVGCPRCNRTGYKGRVGVFQLLIMNDEIESLAAQNAHRDEIERAAAAGGMRSLWDDGIAKAAAGLISLEELGASSRRSERAARDPGVRLKPDTEPRRARPWRPAEAGTEPSDDGAVEVLERDQRLVRKAAGVLERLKRVGPVDRRIVGPSRRRMDVRHDREAARRLDAAERRDEPAVPAELVFEDRSTEAGGCRLRCCGW